MNIDKKLTREQDKAKKYKKLYKMALELANDDHKELLNQISINRDLRLKINLLMEDIEDMQGEIDELKSKLEV